MTEGGREGGREGAVTEGGKEGETITTPVSLHSAPVSHWAGSEAGFLKSRSYLPSL